LVLKTHKIRVFSVLLTSKSISNLFQNQLQFFYDKTLNQKKYLYLKNQNKKVTQKMTHEQTTTKAIVLGYIIRKISISDSCIITWFFKHNHDSCPFCRQKI